MEGPARLCQGYNCAERLPSHREPILIGFAQGRDSKEFATVLIPHLRVWIHGQVHACMYVLCMSTNCYLQLHGCFAAMPAFFVLMLIFHCTYRRRVQFRITFNGDINWSKRFAKCGTLLGGSGLLFGFRLGSRGGCRSRRACAQ